MARRHLPERGRLDAADVDRVRAAGVEVAARRRVGGAGDLALELDVAHARARVGDGHGGHQRGGVRVPGRPIELLRGSHLHELAHVHHGDAVADVPDHPQVVRHEDVREAQAVLQIEQQVQDLRLHGHVERRHRLVGDDEPRIHRQGAGDPDALALAAAEGVREPGHVFGPQAHQAEQLRDPIRALLPVAHAVDQQRLADDVEERHARIERAVGVLEDHLHLGAQRPQLVPGEPRQVDHAAPFRAEQHLAGRRRHRAQDAARRRGLAAAALAHEPEGLALVDREAHVVHRPDVSHGLAEETLLDREVLAEVSDLQQRPAVRGPAVGSHRDTASTS